jgi:hypothetical protein
MPEIANPFNIIGNKTGAGYIVIAVANDNPNQAYLLAVRHVSTEVEYVTWAYEGSNDEHKLITWSGHYFNTRDYKSAYQAFMAATHDLTKRWEG